MARPSGIQMVIGMVKHLFRSSRNASERFGAGRTVRQLRKSPEKAVLYAEKLDCFLGKHDRVSSAGLRAAIDHLLQHPRLGKYTVHGIFPVKPGEFLFVTSYTDEDYDLNAVGMPGMVDHTDHINFLLRSNSERDREEICSHQYTSRTGERVQKRFVTDFFELLDQVSAGTTGFTQS